MSDKDENQQVPSDDQTVDPDVQTDTDNNQDDPKDILIAKLRAEAKKYRQDKAAIKSELETAEAKKLEEQGMFKEMYEKEKQKTERYESAVTRGARSSAIKTALAKEGCNPKYMDLLMKEAALEKIELDDEFRANDDQVAFEVTRLRNNYIDFFKKDVAPPRDGHPSGETPDKTSYLEEIKTAKTQKEFDAIRKKHGRM